MSAAVFLDRDGVINALCKDPIADVPESPLTVADVALLPGVAAAVSKLRDAGYLLVGVTNQPAAAKGKVALEQLEAVHRRVIELMLADGVRFDDFRMCRHHPDGVVPALSGPCDCRKPAPGMLLDAAAEHDIDLHKSWMIGDTDTDVQAGATAGCMTALIEYPGSAHKRASRTAADITASDLPRAVDRLLAWGGAS